MHHVRAEGGIHAKGHHEASWKGKDIGPGAEIIPRNILESGKFSMKFSKNLVLISFIRHLWLRTPCLLKDQAILKI